MVQRGRGTRFLLEPLQAFTIGRKCRRQDLDGTSRPSREVSFDYALRGEFDDAPAAGRGAE
ncbi:MAG TPA: hypothetical protein VFV95_06955 [Vicinamibacterales bacterium]|nr:hypothetical protein [Vicinamibacterales bacterium]